MDKKELKQLKKRQKEERLLLHQEEQDKLEREYMIGKLLKEPCGICGSDLHKAITQSILGDQSTIDYECPAALREEWDATYHHSIFKKNTMICEYKFAQMYGFHKTMIEEAFSNLKEFGAGSRQSNLHWYLMRKRILEICDEQKEAETRFKRETKPCEHSNEDC